jgi:hypothetical protein
MVCEYLRGEHGEQREQGGHDQFTSRIGASTADQSAIARAAP